MKISVRLLAMAVLLIPAVTMTAGSAQKSGIAPSVAEDWTSRHLIFSRPRTLDSARRVAQDQRYRQQWLKRQRPAGPASEDVRTLPVSATMPDLPAQARVPSRPVREQDDIRTLPVIGGEAKMSARFEAPKPAEPGEGWAPGQIGQGKPTKPKKNPPNASRADWGTPLGANGTVGNGMFPAKYNFDITAEPDCNTDFAVFSTSLPGSASQPSIIAYNNLYSTQGIAGGLCGQDGPSVMWAYNTGSGSVVTSPVLSLDGQYVIYVETGVGGAVLHVLRGAAGEGTLGAPVTPTVSLTGLAGCPVSGSCDVQVAILGSPQITNSSPFYNYENDTLYVGDDAGVLHKFTPVLDGTVTEVSTGIWPLSVNTGQVLSSPVIDHFGSGNLFVGDASGRMSYVRESGSSVGACAAGVVPCLGTPFQSLGGAIVDAPIVDVSIGKVFVFVGADPSNKGSVHQFSTSLGSQVTASVGNASIASPLNIHAGTFDQSYLMSVDGTGHLYVCGKVGTGTTDTPAIHRIAINGGTMSAASDGGLALSTETAECSPVTGVFNASANAEYLYFSVGDGSNQTAAGCTAGEGCLMSLNITALNGEWNPPTSPSTVTLGYRVPTAAGGPGTSGIIVDNTAFPTATALGTTASTTLSGSVSTTLAAGGLTTTLNGSVAAATAASGTGEFTATSTSGTVTVNGTVLTSSPGTAASHSTTITANGVASGNTVTVTRNGTPYTVTANNASAQVRTITVAQQLADDESSFTVAGIQYILDQATTLPTPAANTCRIKAAAENPNQTMVTRISQAISLGSGSSNTTWLCDAGAVQPSNGATVTSTTTSTIVLTAKLPGTTGFTIVDPGGGGNNNRISEALTTAGSDGTAPTPGGGTFAWVSGVPVSAATLATNIATALSGLNPAGFTVSNPSAGVVTMTAVESGTAANGITVARTIASGLAGAAFTGNFTGGTSGVTAGATFSTSTDSTTHSQNVSAHAAALASAINANVSGVSASSSLGIVTVTATTPGSAGNSIATTDTLPGFTWAAPTLTGGGNAPTSITVASGAGIVNNDFITVGAETMQVTAGGGTTTLTVTRGAQSTTVGSHANGATVTDISRISSGQTTINVASTSGIANGDVILVESEQMTVSNVNNGTQLTVTRGANSTTPVTHLTGAPILNRSVSDSATTLTLASTAGIAAGDHLRIDSEKVLVGSVSGSQVSVTRAQLSTTAAPHAAEAVVDNLTTKAAATSIFVQSVGDFAVNDYILVDGEIMQITAVVGGNSSFTVTRGMLGTTPAAHVSPVAVLNLTGNSASIYFSFIGNSTAGAPCNGTSGVGCAVKLTQIGLR